MITKRELNAKIGYLGEEVDELRAELNALKASLKPKAKKASKKNVK